MSTLRPPMKWHGGKYFLAKRIVALMPNRKLWRHLVDTHCGGAAIPLEIEQEGVSVVINDVHFDLVNFWKVLSRPAEFEEFKRMAEATPFSQKVFEDACKNRVFANDVERALAFFVRCRQSLAGRCKSFAPLSRTRTRRGMNEQASAWLTGVEGLAEVHGVVKRWAVMCSPANKLIKQQDGKQTFFYCDPTYLPETVVSKKAYEHTMTREEHVELLETLGGIEGKFLLSGYDSELYREHEKKNGWRRNEFVLPNNAAGGVKKRRMVEVLWRNYDLPGEQPGMFDKR